MKIPHDYSAEKWSIPADIQAQYADFEQRVWDSWFLSRRMKGEISDHLVELKLLKRNRRDDRMEESQGPLPAIDSVAYMKHFNISPEVQEVILAHQKHSEASKHANFGTYQ